MTAFQTNVNIEIMTTFWIFIALVVLVSLLLIWVPHFRQQKLLQVEEAGVRSNTNLELFNERLATLEQDLQQNLLDQAEFDALKKELEVSLLQDMKQGEDESLVNAVKPKSIALPALMSVILLGVAGYLYGTLGSYQIIDMPVAEANPHGNMTPEQMMAQQVQMLEMEVKSQPDNSQAWFSLGHAYISVGQYDNAVNAFDKVIDLVGKHAELIGPKATALYYKNGQKMTPQIQALIDESLQMDPKDPSTLLLVGMNAFFTADYNKAIAAWQTILDSDRTDVDRSAVINAIETAKMRLDSEAGVAPKMDAAQASQAVELTVNVSPELASQVKSSDMIFVFARAKGSQVPLAATKVSAKNLPVTVTLDNSTGMGGDQKLSDAKHVEVFAILTKNGSVSAEPGDLQGHLDSVAVGGKGTLTINTVVQ